MFFSEYYTIKLKGQSSAPLLIEDVPIIDSTRMINSDSVIHLSISESSSKKLKMTDCLMTDHHRAVFSDKIYNILKPVPINGLQLLPTVIKKGNKKHTNYWLARVYNHYAFFDKENSKYEEIDEETGLWKNMNKIVFDYSTVLEVPPERRLIFIPKEEPSLTIYNKLLADIIMLAKPKGISFVRIDE